MIKSLIFGSALLFSVTNYDEVHQHAVFGDSRSGASSVEINGIRYDGAAWNYANSPYESTTFIYSRNGKTILYKTAYNGKVEGSVYDSLIPGKKGKTIFTWTRGPLKHPFAPLESTEDQHN
ncbi:hypothetical protein [Nosocomiicoccus ampullae]|uniref:hypothetical protein n=1 Tax=Nosocomiicoccus ampullae TaxID=489910 RepID=UPI002551A3A5|nr:hypothetical protein [Nosocomiicoccus ampullae]MDK6863198.1 hypothetical protein [Nosocomiicoccus ampullae]